jgi:hypothetical protein
VREANEALRDPRNKALVDRYIDRQNLGATEVQQLQQLQRQNLAAAVASIDTFLLSVGQHKSASAPLRSRARHGNRGATAATDATAATTGVRHDGHDATALSWTAVTAATSNRRMS